MKLYFRLILLGILLLAIAFGFAACAPQATPMPTETMAPVVTDAPTEPASLVLEIAGPAGTKSITMTELLALPVTDGYAGIKSSTGKITSPVLFRGVALKDLVKVVGGMDATAGFNLVAKDGYGITFSSEQVNTGKFVAYDPVTGDEIKDPGELTAILAYEQDGKPLNLETDGTLRLVIVSAKPTQVTDGHWSVKWITKVEAKSLVQEWNVALEGAISQVTDRPSIESCGAPQCHGATWKDDKAQEWVGIPLWLLVGSVDDEIKHSGPAFNDKLADAGYKVDVISSDGYSVTFDSVRIKRNNNIIVAYKVNDNPLPDEYFPLRLVGADLQKSEMVGAITNIKVGVEPITVTETPATEPAATEAITTGSFTINGSVNHELSLLEADLRAMKVLKITAENPSKGKQDYEGVSLNTLLDLAGVKDGATTLIITASDGYSSEVSLADVRACADCLLGFTNTAEKFKMVMPGLPSGAWVKDVVSIEVK